MTWHRPEEILKHPKLHEENLIVAVDGWPRCQAAFYSSMLRRWCSDSPHEGELKVLAWMPMPEPPEWVGEASR